MRTFWFFCNFIVDDVWSGGTAEEATKSGYLLMSECIKQGLYHPNCKDSHTTYFGDLLDEEEEEENDLEQTEVTPNDERAFTPEEQKLSEQLYEAEQRENYCERQAERFERLSEYSLDEGNIKEYLARKRNWTEKLAQSHDTVESIKEQITLNEEKQLKKQPKHKGKKPSVIGAMIGQENISDVVQRLSFDMENSEENEEKTVANSAGSGIIYTKRMFTIYNAFAKATTSDELVDAVINNHKALADFTPETMKKMLTELGYDVRPLGSKSSLKGIPFEEGGGYRVSFGGDGYFQYHPKTNSHHDSKAYWRVSNGRRGDNRYDLEGNEF